MKKMKSGKSLSIVVAMAVMAVVPSVSAAPIAMWTFETSVPTTAGPHAAEVGSGDATGVHDSASTVYSNPVGNGSVESFSSNSWAIGDYYQFTTSSVAQSDIIISWDQTRSSTGPSDFEVQYTTDGSTYQPIPLGLVPTYTVPAVTWTSGSPDATGTSSFTRNLSSITALNGNPTIGFRLVAMSAPSSTGGTNRVDNFTVVPEPGTVALIGMLCFALATVSRRAAAH